MTIKNNSTFLSDKDLVYVNRIKTMYDGDFKFGICTPFKNEDIYYSVDEFINEFMGQTGLRDLYREDGFEKECPEKGKLLEYLCCMTTKITFQLCQFILPNIKGAHHYFGYSKDRLGFAFSLRIYLPKDTNKFPEDFIEIVSDMFNCDYIVNSQVTERYVTFSLRFREDKCLREMFNISIPDFFYVAVRSRSRSKSISSLFDLSDSLFYDGTYELLNPELDHFLCLN
jgi:hypothetical protein